MNPYQQYEKFKGGGYKDQLKDALKDSYSLRLHILYLNFDMSYDFLILCFDRFKYSYEIYELIKIFIEAPKRWSEMEEIELYRAVGTCLAYPFYNMAAVYSLYSEYEYRLNKITARNIFSELDTAFSSAIKLLKKIKRGNSFHIFKENILLEKENYLNLSEEVLRERIDSLFKYHEDRFFFEEEFYYLWSKYNEDAIELGLRYNENNLLLLYLNSNIELVNKQIELTKNVQYKHELIIVYLKIILNDSYNIFIKKSMYFIEKFSDERPVAIFKMLTNIEFRYTGKFYNTLTLLEKYVYIEIIEYIRTYDPKLASKLYIYYNLKEKSEKDYTVEYFAGKNIINNFLNVVEKVPTNRTGERVYNKISSRRLLELFKRLK